MILFPGLLALILLGLAGLIGPAGRRMVTILLPFSIALFIIHGFFYPGNHFQILHLGPFSLGLEGLKYASRILFRLISILALSLILVMTTHPGDLIQALTEIGLSNRFAYLFASPMVMIPHFSEKIKLIRDAQQSRGLQVEGNLLVRIKALFPQISPLILGSLVDIEEQAFALEIRGFGIPGPKTHIKVVEDSKIQKWLRILLLSLTFFLILGSLIVKFNGNN